MPQEPEQDYRPQHEGSRLSRRGFMKGAGVSAAGVALLDGCTEALQRDAVRAKAQPKVVGPGAVPVTLNINGQPRRVSVDPRTTLAETLRDELELTGTKVVCDRGACSACTVSRDGTPVCSCMTLAIDTVGKEIKTIEGLADGDRLHPVQAAFVEHDALQCGFCTPGMIMASRQLLERTPQPSEEEIRHGLEGNLCRCTGYQNIVDAIRDCAQRCGPAGV